MYKQSNLRLDLTFVKPLSEPINVIVYGIYDGQVEINESGQVHTW